MPPEKVEDMMYETPEELQHLQALLDRSIEQAGAFLRQSFQMPDHSLSARQLAHFWHGIFSHHNHARFHQSLASCVAKDGVWRQEIAEESLFFAYLSDAFVGLVASR